MDKLKVFNTLIFLLFISLTLMSQDVHVIRGANVILDKKAVRVIKKINFVSPAKQNGEPISFCLVLPINFQLR